jgi:sugar phosphate isomerase/epimerase
VVELAEGSGVRPCLEPMLFSRCRTLADAIETVATTGAGVLVDALHLFRAGRAADAVREAARVHGAGLFPYLQVCDAGPHAPTGDDALREEAVNGRFLPGEGSLPLTGLLAALPGLPLSVEAPTRALRHEPAGVRASEAMRAVRALRG